MHSGLLKQLLNLPSFEGQTFPPEFKYHSDTGKKLVWSKHQSNHYWLGAYGNSIDLSNQPKVARQNGLQLSENLRLFFAAIKKMCNSFL